MNQDDCGFVPNFVKLYSHRPDVLLAWGELIGAIRANMDGRRYELATIAAARALRSSYCMLAHGARLAEDYASTAEATAICGDFRSAGLSAEEVAVMSYSEKIARDATSVTQDDIDELRGHGLTDDDIFDIAATAAARCFFTKIADGLGAVPDAPLGEIDPAFRATLVVGRRSARSRSKRCRRFGTRTPVQGSPEGNRPAASLELVMRAPHPRPFRQRRGRGAAPVGARFIALADGLNGWGIDA